MASSPEQSRVWISCDWFTLLQDIIRGGQHMDDVMIQASIVLVFRVESRKWVVACSRGAKGGWPEMMMSE